MGSISTSQLQPGSILTSDYCQYGVSHTCFPCVYVVFLQVLQFPPTIHKHAGMIANAKFPIGVNVCVNGACQWTSVPSEVDFPTQC